MSPEKRMIGEVYLLLVVSGMVQTQQCRNDSRIVAITTVRKLTSPHVFYNNQFDVSCWWRITASNRDGTICIIVQFPKMNSIRNCMMTYVDVHDGFDIDAKILGRWCDMDSSLLTTSRNQAFIISKTQYVVQFKFDIWYGTKNFSLDQMSDVSTGVDAAPSMSTGVKIGIGVSVMMALVLLSVVARYLIRKSFLDHSENTRRQTPSVSSGAESNPPDYWSVVVSPSRETVAVHVAGNEPPAYWDVVTVSDGNNGLPLHENQSVLSVQEENRAISVQENHSAISMQEDQSGIFQQNHNVIPNEVCGEIALSEDHSVTALTEDHSVTALSQDHNDTTLSQGHRETTLSQDHMETVLPQDQSEAAFSQIKRKTVFPQDYS